MINYMRGSVILCPEFSRLSLFTEGGLFLSGILTDGQREVLGAVLNGHNIFFAGASGSGKSHLVGKSQSSVKSSGNYKHHRTCRQAAEKKDNSLFRRNW